MIDSRYITFIEVCEAENFTAAAYNLGLTQPAVSQHIKQLEEEFGVKLFNRNGHNLFLTNAGEILLKYCKRMQNLEKDLTRKIDDSKKGTNNLTIGITHTSESTITPEILASYSSEKEGTYIRIISDSIKNLYDKLSNFQIDLAIIEGKVTNAKFTSILLNTDSILAIVSKDNKLANKKVISIDELKKERIILRNIDSGTTTLFISALNKLDMSIEDLNVYLELDNVATIKDLVKKNMGISILPRSACLHEIEDGTLKALPIENMHMIRENSLVYIKGNVEKDILEDIITIYHKKMPLN